jgi:hypothetical protein
VRIFARHMAQCDPGHARGLRVVQDHRKANPQINAVLNTHRTTAVGHCARITA